jgi:hypothetical protein
VKNPCLRGCQWFNRHPEIAIGLSGGILAGLIALWFFRRVVISVLGDIGEWLLNWLVSLTHP